MSEPWLKFQFERPVYPDHTTPIGHLSTDVRAQACWHFYVLCQKQKEMVGESTEDQFGLLDTAQWMDTRYEQTARTVAMIHGLESPDEFAKAWDEVKAEAARIRSPMPDARYMRPLKRFLLS